MKRALAIAVALCTLGFAGFSQIALKGSWTATLCILPSITLTSTLNLTYTVAGIDVTSVTGFGATGITSQRFALKGAFGPFSITGNMWFDPAAPAYLASDMTTSFDFGGIGIGFNVRHWMPSKFRTTEWYPDTDPCLPQTPYDAGMLYTFTGTVSPLTVRARFLDCCKGIEFDSLLVTLKGLDLCCGITYNVEFSFLKSGFDYISFSGLNIPLCCGVSLDVTVTYGVDYKKVDLTPKFAGFAEACFTVWGDAVYDKAKNIWEGIEVYGFKIRCTIADCNYIEFVHAFNVAAVNPLLPSADRFLTACGEFELVKIGFCGPGCCGGKYDVSLRVFFGTNGGLFDVTRLVYDVKIPIMTNFTLNLTGTMPAAACASMSFCLGWTFTF